MDSADLIFQPFKLRCPQCRKYTEASFEELQYNDEVTCLNCKYIYTPNVDAQALLALVRVAEEQMSNRVSSAEAKKSK